MGDTTHEISNRMLAERVGWRVVPYYGDSDWDGFALEPTHLKDRDYFYAALRNTADEAWSHIPDYLASVDAALTLPLAEGCAFQLYGVDDSWECTVIQDRYFDERLDVHAPTAAEAVCRAWWAWKAQEGA